MKKMPSSKPYLIRAIYSWCLDAALVPYLAVSVDERTIVPREHVQDGKIILNIGPMSCREIKIDDEGISFLTRFQGLAKEVWVPMDQVIGIFAKENGEGIFFGKTGPVPVGVSAPAPASPPSSKAKPQLRVIKPEKDTAPKA